MRRRDVLKSMGVLLAGSAVSSSKAADNSANNSTTIAMLVYPGMTALDLIGPHHVFSALMGYQVQLVWKDTEPVVSDTGMGITPTMTLEDCPQDLAILFVPGGTTGTLKMMSDPDVLNFLESRGPRAKYVTSVCTGSLVLGAAGLLRGYKATTHWGALEILSELDATPVEERVVVDRNRITGGGVTAGIDFGLTLASEIKGEDYAKHLQLGMEYAPAPPFRAGTPADAGEKITGFMRAMYTPFVSSAKAEAKKAKSNWSQ